MKVRITSIFLAAAIMLSATGCSLSKNNSNLHTKEPIVTESTMDSDLQNDLQSRMISFIEKLENSDVDLDLGNFYQKARTLKIYTDSTNEQYYNSYYDKELNQIFFNIDSPGAFEHELVHVILNNGKELGNIFLEEGFTELLASEVCGTSNTYRFNVGIAKIFCTILGRDKVYNTLNEKDLSIVTKSLASIVPEVKDAEEYMSYLNYEHKLEQMMHQAFFKDGNLDNFKKTEEYTALKNVRSDLIGRIKIYIKNYYMKKVREEGIDPKQLLTEMLSLLDIVDKELYDPDLEGERSNDFFLRDEVNYIMEKYGYTDEDYDACYNNSKVRKYLLEDSSAVIKSNEIKK